MKLYVNPCYRPCPFGLHERMIRIVRTELHVLTSAYVSLSARAALLNALYDKPNNKCTQKKQNDPKSYQIHEISHSSR